MRLVYTIIIFIGTFTFLVIKLEDASVWIQWVVIILFFIVALIIARKIYRGDERDKNNKSAE